MEDIARRKIELKALEHRRALVDNAIHSKILQVDAINEEKSKRGTSIYTPYVYTCICMLCMDCYTPINVPAFIFFRVW